MNLTRSLGLSFAVTLLALVGGQPVTTQTRQRNVIIFVADGLRHGSVNAQDTPSLWRVRTEGVHFENSHSLFPTFTTANAAAIATGHGLGDTGDFSNVIWPGYAVFDTGNFGLKPGTPTPFIESDQILADLHDHFDGNYLGEETLLDVAARNGYSTASIGKLGPVAVQSPAASRAQQGGFQTSASTIVIDELAGASNGLPLSPKLLPFLASEGVPPEAPTRSNGYGPTSPYNNGNAGTFARPGTLAANVVQQQWFIDVATRAVLPLFASEHKPFALLFWSRDPDGTQHNNGDSLGAVSPGINGPSVRRGVQNADRTLGQLLDWLDLHPDIRANTDVFVTSDHGFATISRREIDATGRTTSSEAAKHRYVDANGAPDTAPGMLPTGFVAIDLALGLRLNLFDPDRRAESGELPYRRVRLESDAWEHPNAGDGLIGTDVRALDGRDAAVIVASNGGSDLIYVPNGDVEIVKRVVALLLDRDYVDGVFLNDAFGPLPGTLPMSAIGLIGSTKLPQPTVVVTFKVFYLDPSDLQTGVQLSDTILQEGQGMHGGFGRESTRNNMAALGPDFKSGAVDSLPASNVDIAPTLAKLMGLDLPSHGQLRGRVLGEAFAGAPAVEAPGPWQLHSAPANGRKTLLWFQEFDGVRYLDRACLAPEGAEVCP